MSFTLLYNAARKEVKWANWTITANCVCKLKCFCNEDYENLAFCLLRGTESVEF